MIPDFEIKVTPGSYEEVSERFKTYLRFRFGIDPASVFITGATGSGKSTASISLAIQYVKQGIPVLAIQRKPHLREQSVYIRSVLRNCAMPQPAFYTIF